MRAWHVIHLAQLHPVHIEASPEHNSDISKVTSINDSVHCCNHVTLSVREVQR
jgi:hypothetical protein